MAGESERRAARFRVPWGLVFLGLAVGVGAALVFKVWEPSEPLTKERLAAARGVWSAHAPASYTLEIEIRGALAGRHHVEVRDGEVVAMSTGGAPVPAPAREYWSVDGLFRMMETELANASSPRESFGVEPGGVVLRARFDPATGVPSFFLRHVMGRRQGIEWRVREFEPEPG